MYTTTFVGKFSGDGECFCWKTDLETYKRYDRHWEAEIAYKQEFNIEQGYAKDYGIYEDNWELHPTSLFKHLNVQKKYKITINVEEVND